MILHHVIEVFLGVKLSLKCGCETTEYFNKYTSTVTSVSASANKFTHYLKKSLESIRTPTPTDHSYTQEAICTAIPDKLTEHNYATFTHIIHINLHMEYANLS